MAKAPNNAPGQEIGRKLSVAELGYDKATILKLVLADESAKHPLCRFVGTANNLKPYKIKDGERAGEVAFGLVGNFEGMGINGTVKMGSVLYLPGFVNDMIVGLISSEEGVSVQIAFDVYASYDASAATSYVFSVRDLLNTGADSVAEVKSLIQSLPMPSAPIAIEDKSAS